MKTGIYGWIIVVQYIGFEILNILLMLTIDFLILGNPRTGSETKGATDPCRKGQPYDNINIISAISSG